MSRSRALWVLFFVIIIGVGIRAFELTDRSMWFDEAFSWRLIQLPVTELIERSSTDVHPPLYYIVLKGWSVVFGTSLLSIRSFSVFMSGLVMAAGYLFAVSAWRSRAAGLATAAFIALSGWQIAFAWEARMYTFGMIFAFLTSWLLIKAVRQSHPPILWWIGYGIAAAAFAYIHYFAFFTLAAHALFVTGHVFVTTKGRIGEMLNMKATWYAILSALIAILIYSPWIPSFLEQNQQVQDFWWPQPLQWWSVPDTMYHMYVPTVGDLVHSGWGAIISLIPFVFTVSLWAGLVLICRRSKFSYKKNSVCDATWLTLLCGATPFVLAALMSMVGQSIYNDRFLVFSHLFILVALAAMIWQIRVKSLALTLTALFLIIFSWSSIRYWQEMDVASKPGVAGATGYVMDNRSENAPVIVSSPFIYFVVDYYAQEEHGDRVDPRLYSASGEFLHFAGGPLLVPEDVVGSEYVESAGEEIWVVDTTGFDILRFELSGNWRSVEEKVFPEVLVHQGDVIVNKYVRE